MKKITAIAFLSLLLIPLFSQQGSSTAYCVAEELREELLKVMPGLAEKENEMERWYRIAAQTASKGTASTLYTLPVVVHIVHQNGPENITDAQVEQGIAYLNQSFRNQGYYNPATGADVEIEFCLAQRTPDGNPSNGIVRYHSSMTDMSAPYSHGQIAALATWDPFQYINIRLVKEACLGGSCSTVAGYAYGPSAHGWAGDGIVMEAAYFGSNSENTTVAVHEIGHYLGLLHTFNGGCGNGDCLADGDRVCDTPPDNSTGGFPCDVSYNSCNTDEDDLSPNNPFRSPALGGLGDQPDMYRNYMDYNLKLCRDRFTEGQKARMRFFAETARSSLLSSKACLPPCPASPTAFFVASQTTIDAGGSVALTNQSSNAGSYQWYVDGVPVSTGLSPSLPFDDEGTYTIRLEAISALEECDVDAFEIAITVICPVSAGFDYALNGDWLVFNDQSTNASSILWTVKDGAGTPLFTSNKTTDSLDVSSVGYIQLCLLAANGFCDDQQCMYISLAGAGIEVCNNSLDDDSDGYVDLFDPDCPCDYASYEAYCPVDCEYVPDIFPEIQMGLMWVSDVIANYSGSKQTAVVGDVDGDGKTEVISTVDFYTPPNPETNIKVFDGTTGATKVDFGIKPNTSYPQLSVADIDKDGDAELFEMIFVSIYSYNHTGDLLWVSEDLEDYRGVSINICDFNADGTPELYVGDEILSTENGKILASGNAGEGCNIYNSFVPCVMKQTIAADLLPSPGLELAAGNTVYQIEINNNSGTSGNNMVPVVAPLPVRDGFTSVGDINGDGELDVVVVRDNSHPDGGGIWVWDPRMLTVIASASAGNYGGVAFIGDVTGDCVPEIGMTFRYELRMYQYDGTPQLKLLYNLPTTDQSGITGLTMFDFNQDGRQELVYRDETDLRILDGETGSTLASYPLKSGTWLEYPVIADVDNDGQAEILVNGYEDENNIELRVYCFESATSPWAPARSVWNQYGYHVTNVNDDLTIPRQEQNMAKPLEGHEECLQPTCPAPYNAFLSQATYRTQQGCVQWPADGDISITSTMRCVSDNVEICVFAENVDTLLYPLGFPAWCGTFPEHIYFPNGTTILDTFYIKDSFCFLLPAMILEDIIFVTVNDPAWPFPYGGNPPYTECDYSNNTNLLISPIEPKTLDLGPDIVKCASEVITLHAGASFETYLWNDATTDSIYSSGFPGPHFVEATDQCGKVYRDTVIFTIDPTDEVSLGPGVLICPGDTLGYSLTGNYDMVQWLPAGSVNCDTCMQVALTTDTAFLLTVVVGKGSCFSADTVAIEVAQRVDVQLDTSICEGEAISFMGSTLAAAGEYEFSLNGCDSFLTVNLSLFGRDTTLLQETVCTGDSVFFGGTWLKDSGTYLETLANGIGCDSLLILGLEVVNTIEASNTLVICGGDSINVFGQWVYDEVLLDETYTSASGCDSTQYYQVLVTPLPHLQVGYSVCQGDSIFVGGEWLSGTGQHTVILASQTGCDTVLEVSLTETLPVSNTDTLIVCEGDSVNIFGQWVHSEMLLDETYTSASGCDSTQYYQVVELAMAIEQLGYELCQGDSVLVGGEWLTGAGNYSVLASSGTGCDTLYEVSIQELLPASNTDTVKICEGDSTLIFGNYISNPGTYSAIFSANNNCDSTQVYIVEILPYQYEYDTLSTCDGDSLYIGGQWVYTTGTYTDTVANMPCNTISYIWVEFKHIVQIDTTVSLCPGDSIWIENNWVKNTGEYSAKYTGVNGCDSISHISVVALEAPSPPYTEVDCENLEVLVGIQAQAGWEVLWDNGDTTLETIYKNSDTAWVAMSALPDCEVDFAVPLPRLPDLVEVPQQENLAFAPGQSVSFDLQLDPSEWKVVWSPSGIFTCDTCLSTLALPTGSTTIEATYTHASGCIYQNSFLVFMEKVGGIYVPNAFSPNGDGTNDRWEVLLPEGVAQFDEVLVFGRWGSLVAQWHGIPLVGWDGSFRGRPLDPDVFVYYIRYTDRQGRKVEVKGDVALLRGVK